MFRKTLIGLFIWIGGNVGFAQHSDHLIFFKHTCGASYREGPAQVANPASRRIRSTNSVFPSDSLLSLPVIVHLVHQGEAVGTGSNLSFSQILSQFEVLNEDFRRLPNTNGFNISPISGDSFIEFVPAELDPQGEPLEELGIHRINAQELGWNTPPYNGSYIDGTIKPQSQWNPNRYLNVWVLDLEFFNGLAQFPDASGLSQLEQDQGPSQTDGIVIDTEEWGAQSFSFGRIVTHELGHFLGLIHTWGRGGCESDDGCEDTPPSSGPINGCPIEPFSCGNAVMKENYMDLTGGACQHTFTQCQIRRMRQVLSHSPRRRELLTSPVGRVPKVAPQASFSTVEIGDSCSGTLQFIDESFNQPFFWAWDFGNGTTSEDPSPIVTFSQAGVYPVTLTVRNFRGSTTEQIDLAVCIISSSNPVLEGFIQLESPRVDEVSQRISLGAQLKRSMDLQLSLFDMKGKKLADLFQGNALPGNQQIEFSYAGYAPGLYLLVWEAAGVSLPQKVLLR